MFDIGIPRFKMCSNVTQKLNTEGKIFSLKSLLKPGKFYVIGILFIVTTIIVNP